MRPPTPGPTPTGRSRANSSPVATSPDPPADPRREFEVTLENFSGPFDLLLQLIARRRLDVTEVALAVVTDEFISYIRGQGGWDLSQASEFLVIAATLLDLKAARLLPSGTVDDTEDLELLEARDLLFARLLQYRAFKEVAGWLEGRWHDEGRSLPREVGLEPAFAAVLPELVMQIGAEDLARLAAGAMAPKAPPPGVDLTHLHHPVVSVREQAAVLVERLRRSRAATFRDLVADAESLGHVVARFLALLELFREQLVGFEQAVPLGDLTVRWTGQDEGTVNIGDDFDEERS
ncbi:segregation/condensation protein A [Pseudactinotalea sp. HY160]|uniref:segregation and condensation protein A n=1 Tax=Pseudactinotalea sp. HY160 TaxID=2654490 RepID=UPI00128B4907|nr:segregation/condensation protein A [Pseudactinotalea sp. HY160]